MVSQTERVLLICLQFLFLGDRATRLLPGWSRDSNGGTLADVSLSLSPRGTRHSSSQPRPPPEGRPRSRAGGLAAMPYMRFRHPLSVLGINYQQFLRHYLENYPIAPGRIQELEERRRRFVEACRAREAAFDIEYLRNPQRVDFDILTFTIALTASEVINPLIEELGCDKFIHREWRVGLRGGHGTKTSASKWNPILQLGFKKSNGSWEAALPQREEKRQKIGGGEGKHRRLLPFLEFMISWNFLCYGKGPSSWLR